MTRGIQRSAAAIVAIACAASCGARSELQAQTATASGAGGGAGAGGDGGAGGMVACMTGTVTLSRANPAVMFVIDSSGSMEGQLGQSSGKQSRWAILTQALSATLPPVDDSMEIGALIYPTGASAQGDLSCAVPAAPALMPAVGNVASLIAQMSVTSPSGGTPTADAITAAAKALSGVHAATTARSLVLATDGGPNCNEALDVDDCECVVTSNGCNKSTMCLDDTRTIQRIAGYQEKGLPTYVIGIQEQGDAEFTDVLNAMADAGGRPKAGSTQHYYAASSAEELESALAAIRDQVGLCTFLISSVPDEGGSISVQLGDAVLPYDPQGMDGWMWGNKDNGEVVLVGSACASATASPTATLVGEVTCAAP